MISLWFSFLLVPAAANQPTAISHHKITVYQSSVGSKGVPDRAVDRDIVQDFRHGSCTSTYEQTMGPDNWWLMDLGQRARIDRMRIWNRWDCCADRINGAKVWVDGTEVAQLWNSQSLYTLQVNTVGRYVRITQQVVKILTLCEVTWTGEYLSETEDSPSNFHYPILVSRHKPVSVSGTTQSAGAVDGVFHGASGHDGICARAAVDSNSQSSLQVDLQENYMVTRVVLYPRLGTGQQNLGGAKVFVDDALCGVYHNGVDARNLHALECPSGGLIGSKVTVVRDNNHIELCEAEVFGVKYDPPTDPPTTLPVPTCKDFDDQCPILAAQQKCSDARILAKCPLSCHQCSCGDNYRSCKKLKENGLCQQHADFMNKHCRLSCDLCQCADSLPGCSDRAAQGHCTLNPLFLAQCPLSCNQCQCGDNLETCSTLAQSGQCVHNPTFMLVHCAKSCNQCDNCADNPPFSVKCAEKAARGECWTDSDMAVHCAVTCNYCARNEDADDGDWTEEEFPWI